MRQKTDQVVCALDPAQKKRSSALEDPNSAGAVLSALTCLVVEVGLDGRIRRVIPTGYPFSLEEPANLVGRHIQNYLQHASESDLGDLLHRVVIGRKSENRQSLLNLDHNRWFHVSLSPFRQDTALVTATDISLAKVNQVRYQDVVELSNRIVFRLDAKGRVSFFNHCSERFFGFSRAEVIDRPADETFMRQAMGDYRPLPASNARPDTNVPQMVQHQLQNGDLGYVAYHKTPLYDGDHQVGELWVGSDVTEQEIAREELQKRSFYDALTGLPNRALFVEQLKHAFERYLRRTGKDYAVLFLGVDRLKVINDSLGHAVGDRLLQSISELLDTQFRKIDTVARFGNDEFVILIDEMENDQAPVKVAERIRRAFQRPFQIGGREIFVSVSIGIAYGVPEYEEPLAILRDADTAMHQAKAEERGGYRIFQAHMHSRVRQILSMETDLRRALASGEFHLHYQPIMDMRTGRTTAMEALIRWEHPEKGWVSPGEFIPIAEESGLIVPIGQWVLSQACREIKDVLEAFFGGRGQLSLNLSARQFLDPDLLGHIMQTIEQTGMAPRQIKLEITETSLMQNASEAGRIIEKLKVQGLSIAIDDFGTGYSSLSYLQQFPFDTLKIDRSFIKKLREGHSKETQIISVILSLAKVLDMDVVAEGIETAFQRAALIEMDCPVGQGFLYARPMDIAELRRFLASEARNALR